MQAHLSTHQPQSLKQLPGQSVFKVQTKPLNHQGTLSRPPAMSSALGTGNFFQARKTHKKSRTGCRNCKVRRIKCDENKADGCNKCRSHGMECDYLSMQPHPRSKPFEIRARPSSLALNETKPSVSSTSLHSISAPNSTQSALPLPLPLSLQPSLPISPHQSDRMTTPMEALHHFSTLTLYTCGSPQGQAVVQSCILERAMQIPYLLHAVLGVAAAHLSVLLPAEANTIQHSRHKLADAYHWGRALKLFRTELANEGPNEANMDSLISTIMLIAIYQFALRDENGTTSVDNHLSKAGTWSSSFVFIEDDHDRAEAMKWLSIQTGFKILLNQLGSFLEQSVWMPVLQDAALGSDSELESRGKTWECGSLHQDAAADEVEKLFCELCDVDGRSDASNNHYFGSLELVLHLRRMRPIKVEHFNKAITFMGRITPTFRQMLINRDSAALLILAHWLSLLIGIRQWWICGRAELECKALVTFLGGRNATQGDGRLQTLLREPAQVVGIRI